MAFGSWAGQRWKQVWTNGTYRIDLLWDYCQDIANNQTKISMKSLRVASLKSGYNFYSDIPFECGFGDFDGSHHSERKTIRVGSQQTVVLDFGHRHSIVNHNSDGTWNSGYRGWWCFKTGLTIYNIPNVDWTPFYPDGIPTIPRATNPSLSKSTVEMGTSVTVNLPRATSSFTHNISYKFGDSTGTISSNAGASASWSVPLTLAEQIKNSTSGTGTITVQTKNGNSVIGSKTLNITLTVPESVKPSITAQTVTEGTTEIADKFGSFVQSKSTFNVSVNASGAYGSEIVSYRTDIEGRQFSGNPCLTGTVTGSGDIEIISTVTDSRGRSESVTKTVSVIGYNPPGIATSSVRRTSDNSLSGICEYKYEISSLGAKNDKSFKIQYLSGSTWKDLASFTDYAKTGSVTTGEIFGVDSTTKVRFVAKDYFSEVSIEREVGPTFTLINFGTGGTSIALGMVSGNRPNSIQNALTQVPSLRTSGSGRSGYMKILQVKTKAQMWNHNCVEFEFYVGAKAKPFTKGSITVIGGRSTDPNVGYIRTSDPDVPIYVVKANKNTWDIYVNKVGDEQIGFMNVRVYRPDGVTASVQNQWIETLPDGYVKSEWEHLDAVFPVNSVKITTDAKNPGTKLGGTWIQFAEGRTLIGQGTGSDGTTTKTFAVNSTGGVYSHIHEYNILYREYIGSINTPHAEKYDAKGNISWNPSVRQSSRASSYHLGSSGSGISDIDQYVLTGQTRSVGETLMPYQVVYFWKRTA